MRAQPAYFETIRTQAARVWEQLEADPGLAGPWHQLFRQVQSPRHVLSELLQNADDVGATEASVAIREGVFIFEHNGEDFKEDHFASLCRFGYSNKRTLHTIGFRGVGFKSTFSLGDSVELRTPTLSVAFERRRFTEPRWLGATLPAGRVTRVQVTITDSLREREVARNLREWPKSPLSLLFFRNIRRLTVNDTAVHWRSFGIGPVPNTEWMGRQNSDQNYLVARSDAVAFPEDCLTEIRQERLLAGDEAANLPPCQVEIVLGALGRLFVVLPTGVETKLPFACNAPFVQDPARLKIKDPETSPTNQWLLKRAGALAAEVMLQWLNSSERQPGERAPAYGFLPNVDREDGSLEGACGCLVEESFQEALQDRPILLTDDGSVTAAECVALPSTVLDVWPSPRDASVFDPQERPLLSRNVSVADRQKLVEWGFVEEIAKSDVIEILKSNRLPRPQSWAQLLELWTYVAPELQGYLYYGGGRDTLCIVPVQGQEVLYPPKEVSRLGEKRLLQSEDDWQFLSNHLLVLNQNWPRYLAEQRRVAETEKNTDLGNKVNAAYSLLKTMGIEGASEAGKIINQVASAFFAQKEITLAACVRLAQIAAKLNGAAGDGFRFVTRDRTRRPTSATLLFDPDGTLDPMLPEDWCKTHLLHESYSTTFTSCSKEEWDRWVGSGRNGLTTFVPFAQKQTVFWSRSQLDSEMQRRDFDGHLSPPYVTQHFILHDWDFPDDLWRHWRRLGEESNIWGQVATRILAQPEGLWSDAMTARVLQVATTGNTRSVTYDPIRPSWIVKLRELPCLKDTRGFYHKPSDLLRRTAETESLIDVEPFIHASLDREGTRDLLDLLSVRNTPTGPERLLDCLRALSKTDHPPLHEVDKWYHRLDQMMDTCSTADLIAIRQAFQSERLIFSERSGWVDATSVFLSANDEDVPDAALVRASVRHLALWSKLGVAERPTADLALQWLKELPSNRVLSPDDSKRVRSLLAPAGMARRADVVWLDHKTLYLKNRPMAKLARNIAQELGRAFRRQDIIDAIKLCFERPASFVSEYLEENFELAGESEALAPFERTDSPVGVTKSAGVTEARPEPPAVSETDETLEASEDANAPEESDESDVPERPNVGIGIRVVKVRAMPPKIPLMERFALNLGYAKDGDDGFRHANGSRIVKTLENSFPWEQRTRSGDLVRCYRPKDHCLEREPLQIESDVWSLADKFPERYALVLVNPNGNPVELSGTRLRQLRDEGRITLYPATYRIVYEGEQDAEEEAHRSRAST